MKKIRIVKLLALSVVFTFIFTALIPCVNFAKADQTARYVSVSGSDENDGSVNSPWRHIQFALDNADPGTVINVFAGTYNEKINITKSGTEGNLITLQNYNGGKVILSGIGTDGDTMMAFSNVKYIDVKGIEIANNIAADIDTCPVGVIINEGSTDITVENCNIHDINCLDNENGNANPFLVIGNTTAVVKNITVKNNVIHDCGTGWSEGLCADGNVDGWSFIGNTIYNVSNIGIDAAGHWETGCETPELNQARNGLISGNYVHDCGSPNAWAAGIYVDGAKNVVLEKNTSYNNQYGFEIGCEQITDTYDENYGNPCTAENIVARDNVAYNNLYCGLAVGGWNKNESGKVVGAKVLNNTLYKNDTDNSGMGDLNIAWSDDVTIENNIVVGDDEECLVLRDPVNPVTNIKMDYNIYYLEGKNAKANYAWGTENDSTPVSGFEKWKEISGLDAHSVFADPKFKDVSSNNFELTNGSPAINAGDPTFIAASNETDYLGKTRIDDSVVDIGAIEFVKTVSKNNAPSKIGDVENPKTGTRSSDVIIFVASTIVAAAAAVYVSLRRNSDRV